MEDVRQAVVNSPHACTVGTTLHDIFAPDEFFENFAKIEEDLVNKAKKTSEEEKRGKMWDAFAAELDNLDLKEVEEKKQQWKRSNLRGIRWKIIDTLRSRRTDGTFFYLLKYIFYFYSYFLFFIF